ncbi:MAG TPA: type 4a pilus biogenesis protein PilO [Haliangium sp.]|nr:type 4a pilus biogenesis protein PilO [Haliangium sp.]
MAGRSFLDNIPKWTSSQKLVALLGPPVLLGLLYYQFGYVAASEEQAALDSRQVDLLSKQSQLDKDLEIKKKLMQRMEELQANIRANERALPTSAELPAFFDFLQRRAGEAGVSIRKWEQQPSEKVDIYVRVPVKIDVAGSFSSLVKFFYLLGPVGKDAGQGGREALAVGERIVSVEDLSLGEAKIEDGEVMLLAKFVAATFYLDPTAQPGQPGVAPAGAAAAQPAATGGAR